LDSRHGIELGSGSRLWLLGDDSEVKSEEDDDISSSVLIQEAVQAGFSIEQLRQVEDGLVSLTPPSIKVKPKTSLSSKIVEVWMDNRRKKCAPWKGSLSKPRVSPSRTFDDALALVMKIHSHANNI
jgi:hypothetical protein